VADDLKPIRCGAFETAPRDGTPIVVTRARNGRHNYGGCAVAAWLPLWSENSDEEPGEGWATLDYLLVANSVEHSLVSFDEWIATEDLGRLVKEAARASSSPRLGGDLVERLRTVSARGYTVVGQPDAATIMAEAATALEHYQALVLKLSEALEPFADMTRLIDDDDEDDHAPDWSPFIDIGHYRRARKALAEVEAMTGGKHG
jgi:hypothetical protein